MTFRDLPAVVSALLAVIPADQTRLRQSLERVSYQSAYTAPELMHYRWAEITAALSNGVPNPRPAWGAECARIVGGRS